MPNSTAPNPTPKTDVLQAGPHQQLSAEVIAKAIARHKREHPGGKTNQPRPKSR